MRSIAALLVVSTLTIGLFSMPMASAQEPADSEGSVSLIEQSNWVSNGGTFDLAVRVDVDVPLDQAELAITVYGATPNRSQFQRTLDGDGLGQVILLERQQLEGVVDQNGVVRISLPVQDPQQRRYFLRNSGVFPVKVELRSLGTTRTIDSFTTHLANLAPGGNVNTRLGVVPVLSIAAPTVRNDVLSLPDNDDTSETASSTLSAYPQIPISVLPSPETLERIAGTSTGETTLAGLRSAVGSRQVLTTTWVPSDAALFSNELSVEGRMQLNRGRDVTQRLMGNADPEIFVSRARTDENTVREMRQAGASRLLLPDDSLQNAPGLTTLRPFDLRDGNREPIRAMQIDTGLYRHFIDSEGPVLGAHRLLAELAVLWNDTPGQQRAVVLTGPPDAPIDPTFINIVLRGISDSPFVQPTALDSAFDLPDATSRARSALEPENENRFDTSDVRRVRDRVNAVGSIFQTTSPTRDQLQKRLLFSESAVLDQRRQGDLLDSASRAVDETIARVRLPAERSIRLTASEGELPVSVQNDTGEPIRVVVRLSSDRASFPSGVTKTLDAQRAQLTERFPIEAKTSGVFPVQMRLETPDGSVVLARSQTLVSSTATSGVGLALTIGAGSFLILWWIRSALKTRRKAQ